MPSGGVFAFGPYQLDTRARRLLSSGSPVDLSPRQFDVLHALVASAGTVVPKERLIDVGWRGTFVGDSSLEKLILQLRQRLDPAHPLKYIKTAPRLGYQLVEPVARVDPARVDVDVYALLAPYRAWIQGRAALETLERDSIAAARTTFEELVRHDPHDALFHIGLANTSALQYETTRAELAPDVDALRRALVHAHEAFRLSPDLAEASATLGFVIGLDRNGDRLAALAALQRAVRLEPDSWLHLFRLSATAWGEQRYRTARRTLAIYQGFALAHVLAATVKVACGDLDEAERQLDAALTAMTAESSGPSRFSAVAVHWLKGLLCLARGADDGMMAAFQCEFAREHRGHLYAKECCANVSYAIGAWHLRAGNDAAARAAFLEAIARVPRHVMAHAGLKILSRRNVPTRTDVEHSRPAGLALQPSDDRPVAVEVAMAQAALLVADGDTPAAVRVVAAALAIAPPGNAGWLIPIDPLLDVRRAPDAWAPVLQQLRDRAS